MITNQLMYSGVALASCSHSLVFYVLCSQHSSFKVGNSLKYPLLEISKDFWSKITRNTFFLKSFASTGLVFSSPASFLFNQIQAASGESQSSTNCSINRTFTVKESVCFLLPKTWVSIRQICIIEIITSRHGLVSRCKNYNILHIYIDLPLMIFYLDGCFLCTSDSP